MSRVYTITQMEEDESEKRNRENTQIANDYLVAGRLCPDEEIKKLVLSSGNQDRIDRITSAYNTAQTITPGVARVVLPGMAANIKILQEANEILGNHAEEMENELNIVTEQRDVLKSKLEEHESPKHTSYMLDKIRQERETQLRLQPKKSRTDIIHKQLARAIKRQLN